MVCIFKFDIHYSLTNSFLFHKTIWSDYSLIELKKHPVEGFSAGLVDDSDIYKWDILIIGPQNTLYEGGFFKAVLTFPKEYPLRPPKLKVIFNYFNWFEWN